MTRRSQLDAQAAIRAHQDRATALSAARDAVIEAARGYVSADLSVSGWLTKANKSLFSSVEALNELEWKK